jgi:hypothetical protein
MAGPLLTVLQLGHAASLRPAWRRLREALADPARAQAERLAAVLAAGRGSRYGEAHRFDRITSMAAYQDRVPVVDYDALAPWIARVADGEAQVLTTAPVRMVERSSGSTAATKLIPYTDGLLAEFSAATNPWIHDLLIALPALLGTRSYWSVSPATRGREVTRGGVPIGFTDDTEYFGPLARWALRRMLAVPPDVARLPDVETWRRATIQALLAADDLGLLSVWSPTFLTLLLDALAADLDGYLAALAPARRRAVRRALDREGHLIGEALWPRLALISCWTEGAAAGFLPALRAYFPRTRIQGKGLLATEGVVSVPLVGLPAPVLAVTSHLLELVDLEHPAARPLLAPDLRVGGLYSPILSTSGGLYRYALRDVIACVGHAGRTPCVRFRHKLDRVSDLAGEKLSAGLVESALDRARRELGLALGFALIAPVVPEEGPPHYCLFVEADAPGLADVVERVLGESHHYAYCRRLGQLGPLRVQRAIHGWATYEAALRARGQRAGDIKPTHLDTWRGWSEVFSAPA